MFNKTASFDSRIIHMVQSVESPFLTSLARGLSLVGSSSLAIGLSLLIMLLLYLLLKHRVELLLFLWVGVGSHLLNTLLKLRFHRERPNIHRIIEEVGYSFPSGHSMAAFSLYGVVTFLLWRHISTKFWRLLLIGGAVLVTSGIGWSRIYLGVHYPSDVIGGYAASCAWLMLSIAIFRLFRAKDKIPS
ncbi:phosphatase PAP2 family protein [Paenibacillus sp. sgz500958]|uniref:phosphatase PAP2 family protein n=1 Tax=Paenibacillus sp. sgz500958 TaxID=3242475 RepID=UPI0036D270AA